MLIEGYRINAFAKTSQGGNPAGVILDADALTSNEMKNIAAKLGFSETAYVCRSDLADVRVRFFAPSEEVDLCGHATVGTFAVLAKLGRFLPGAYRQETKAGILAVEISDDHRVMMEQNLPEFGAMLEKDEIADSLHIDLTELCEDLPVQIVSTGLRDIMIPIKRLKTLNNIRPDMDKIKQISSKHNAVGYHVFTSESVCGADANCRNFAPLYGIPEESATGTANGALGCYLFQNGFVPKSNESHFVIKQGDAMQKPSEIIVVLRADRQKISKVSVGGYAMGMEKMGFEI